jgi:GNAT superfamily N-acetyltransferase
MQIAYLADHPRHISTVALWLYEEWGRLNPGDSLEGRVARLSTHTGRPGIPTTLIALENETLLGSASLVENDLTSHPHLTPFMASVYVQPDHRRRGIATVLVQKVMATANQLGVNILYLITHDQQRLYTKLGWAALEELDYRGESVTLMQVRCSQI